MSRILAILKNPGNPDSEAGCRDEQDEQDEGVDGREKFPRLSSIFSFEEWIRIRRVQGEGQALALQTKRKLPRAFQRTPRRRHFTCGFNGSR